MKSWVAFSRQEAFRITSLNSLSVLLKVLAGVITSKVIAVFIGPAGMALTGNLRSFLTMVEAFCMLGLQNGIVKFTADNRNSKALSDFLSTVAAMLLAAAIVLSIGLFVAANYIADLLFTGIGSFSFVIRALALSIPWYGAAGLLVAVLNGLGKYRRVLWVNSLVSICSLFLSVSLIYQFQTVGALLSVVVAPALQFFIVLFWVNKQVELRWFFPLSFARDTVLNLLQYSLMALVAAAGSALVLLFVRHKVIEEVGLQQAGWWEAMMRISSYYMLFLSTLLTVYFLPELSRAFDRLAIRQVYRLYFKNTLPLFLVGLFILYFARDLLIKILFTPDFQPMSSLFFWQLMGDLIKAASLILGYTFFAKKLTVAFIVTEIISLVVLYLSSIFLLGTFGLQGVVMAHAFTYSIYLIILCYYFRQTLFRVAKPSDNVEQL